MIAVHPSTPPRSNSPRRGNKADLLEIGKVNKKLSGGDHGNQHTGGKVAVVSNNDTTAKHSTQKQHKGYIK
jgi:hypothetical protein